MSAVAANGDASAASAEWQPRTNPWLIALSVMTATFMVVLDTSIASVALPYIAGNLGATRDESTWVLTSYLVSNAIVLPASAWFSLFFGRKRFLLVCIVIFTLASVVCGISTSIEMLIIARVLQGAGGGAMQPISQAIMLESFPPAKRGAAMAMFGVGVVIAPIVGPTLGGWLTTTYSWRWAFYINLPVGVIAVFLISFLVEDPPYIRNARPGRIDSIGFGLMALWLGTLQITLDKGQEADWFAAVWLRWLVLISSLSMIGFIVRELITIHPIVDLRILKNRNFAVGCGLYAMFGAALYALIALQPLFLQTLLGYTALDAGLTVSPRGLGSIVALFLVGALVERVNPRLLIAFGFLSFGVSSYWLSRMNLDVSMSSRLPANILNGFGSGFVFVPLITVAMGTLKNEQMGNATGIQNLLRNIGGSIGLSYVSTMLERYAQAHQALMVGHLTPLNPIYVHQLGSVQRIFESHFSPPDALHRAEAFLYNLLLQQADYWSFVDLFYLVAWLCLGCALGTLFFKSVKPARTAAAAEM
ncbi:MAG: DHA2 family efflux MFS transporter permease subunit [Candidatus Omnitrophica bacterium]|nr:DHA2 family efflux MFS transporter permease subunit [Candidatus Omnitrophota bacterium]